MRRHIPGEVRAVEINGEEIVMVMSPGSQHELIVRRVGRQPDARIERQGVDLIAHGGAGPEDPAVGVGRRPDVMVFPESCPETGEAVHPRDVVVEVVSRTNPENDHEGKTRDYPATGIPCYLLPDPRKGTGALHPGIHRTPEGPRYGTSTEFAFGETVRVGDWTVDTSVLPAYG
ncbi:Uma2 family endonuclease [Streptomyces sp. CNQ085]|uniref:Uma2 family endonuclease n=1 Tax=Streptomyces sp. CNQ085 TaxID=2886944 RepID=UPI001F50FF89|nr:Uma2 family endonuclease [Streptomyces sp. CNQ085]MCI0383283.1 Uma2 family endonuclease [Streptomyces sp. CNQ085]